MTSPSLETPPVKDEPGALQRFARRLSLLFRYGVLVIMIGGGALFAPGPMGQETTVIVTRGSSAAEIGAQLAHEGVVYISPLFRIAARIVASNSLKAGEYEIPPHASAIDIALMMHEGRVVVRLFTVAEGLTAADVVNLLNADPVLTGVLHTMPAEGSLLPETYRYSYGDSRETMIARMQKAMQEKLSEVWATHESTLLQSPQEAVILASIVEKETGKPQERPRIAGVFYNRLRLHMRLQSDPTVIYAITRGQGPLNRTLTHDDLGFVSPINTYTSDGLPPQPICNPGVAALQAVTHPEHNDFLYFVADGTGGHAFAADLATQDKNINKWHQAIDNAANHK